MDGVEDTMSARHCVALAEMCVQHRRGEDV